jgi:iron(III) transport system ATP-binding protein
LSINHPCEGFPVKPSQGIASPLSILEVMTEITVFCQELNKSFDGLPVVKDLSLAVPAGNILALLGPSGCGKTTTLRLIAGFEKLDSGLINIADRVVANGRMHMPPEQRKAGMVFQDYAIFPHLTVARNVSFGLGRDRRAGERTQEMLALVGLDGVGDKMPHELSGGQQQRIALARALAPEPAVLLLDEPFSNLDTALRSQVRGEVRDLLKEGQVTAIFVTHDQEEALFIGDQIGVMNEGTVEQIGAPDEIFHRPATRFVADFIGQADFISGSTTEQGVETALGLLKQPTGLAPGTIVEVAVRPDDVDMIPAGDEGNGRVVDHRFVGIANIYTIAVAGGVVRSWQPHTVRFAAGATVNAVLRPEHPLVCFYQGTAIG